MSRLPLKLPTIQNWNCHNCSGCCRQHAIEVTDEERRRIEQQAWSEQDGIGPNQPVFVPMGGPPWKRRYRLAHQDDGACIFLREDGLCKIHAKFGEDAKPLACRVYPYAFHPAGKQVTVSLRFSCPSVVSNRGKKVSEQPKELKKIAREVVPDGADKTPPPRVSSRVHVDWPDLLRFVNALDATMAEPDVPVVVKLLRALFWINLVDEARFDKILGDRLAEFLELIAEAATAEIPAELPEATPPSPLGRVQFRMLSAQYARKDTFADLSAGWKGRWNLFRSAVRFTRGTGTIPPLQEAFREVPFDDLEGSFGPLPPAAEEILTRYLRVKIQGLHFCGPAYYDVPLVEGFRSLALIVPVILWQARWLAVGEGRKSLTTDDVARAMAIADHHHGYSPIFGSGGFRRRVRLLARTGDIGKLCVWYGR